MTPAPQDAASVAESIARRFTVIANEAEIMLPTLIAEAIRAAVAAEREACAAVASKDGWDSNEEIAESIRARAARAPAQGA